MWRRKRILPLLLAMLQWVAPVSMRENSAAAAATCKPQGLLKLMAPYPPPRNMGVLPFCSEYAACTCCEHQHIAQIYHGLRAVLVDASFSPQCASYLGKLACRVCDPLVGTGQRPKVCRHLCDSFFGACADEYFAFNAASGMLTPCASQGQQQALVCSRAHDLAVDGGELCTLLGSPPGDDASLCWSGSEAPVVLDSCKAGDKARGSPGAAPSAASKGNRAPAAAKKGGKRGQKQAKARTKRAAGASYSTADLILLGVVAACSLWAGYQLLGGSTLWERYNNVRNGAFLVAGHRLGGAPRTAKHKRAVGAAGQ